MKSLVLKDLFNIGHNAKSMLFILVVFAVALIPFSGVEGYIFVCAILCSMMIVTTFSFDDSSKWTRYAMIMPVSKKELVAGKFMVLAIFCAIGSLFGLIIGFIGGLITHKIVLDIVGIGELLFLYTRCMGNLPYFWKYVNSSCVQVWRRKRPCSAISIIPHSGRDLLWNISASYYAGSCIDRPDCIYSSLLLTASGVGMVLCDVSNQLSHFCKARALISIGRYLYGKQKI